MTNGENEGMIADDTGREEEKPSTVTYIIETCPKCIKKHGRISMIKKLSESLFACQRCLHNFTGDQIVKVEVAVPTEALDAPETS